MLPVKSQINHLKHHLLTVEEAAEIARVQPHAILRAIKKGYIIPISRNPIFLSREDLDTYRAEKYGPTHTTTSGQLVWNVEYGHMSIPQMAKFCSWQIGKPYNYRQILQKVKRGVIRAFLKGRFYVIDYRDAMEFIETEKKQSLNFSLEKRWSNI